MRANLQRDVAVASLVIREKSLEEAWKTGFLLKTEKIPVSTREKQETFWEIEFV